MKSLDKVIKLKEQLERQLVVHPYITGIEISTSSEDIKPHNPQYIIRVLVNDPEISFEQLGIPALYKGVPINIGYRKIELR